MFRLTSAAAVVLAASIQAHAQNLEFVLDNQSSITINEFYASPSDVRDWEEDILGQDVLPPGEAVDVTIADGREQCEYDLRIVAEDGQVLEDTIDLCETGSYTVTD